MSSSPDVLILGGGVIGLTMAYYLAKERVRVEIVDKGDLGQEASWAGAGMIPPSGNPRLTTKPYDELLSRSSEMFWPFTRELSDCGGVDCGYCGSTGIVFLDEDDKETAAAWRKHEVDFELLEERNSIFWSRGSIADSSAAISCTSMLRSAILVM